MQGLSSATEAGAVLFGPGGALADEDRDNTPNWQVGPTRHACRQQTGCLAFALCNVHEVPHVWKQAAARNLPTCQLCKDATQRQAQNAVQQMQLKG